MFGRISEDDNGIKIVETIAGPTDGSTDIVHHDTDEEFQLATAYDNQYGAGYLGISNNCKVLFNPSTGNVTADCFTGTATCVDVNSNSNADTSIAQPILVQGIEDGLLNNTVEDSPLSYNNHCYVCNDEEGNPVYKQVTCIPVLCANEVLGLPPGIETGETDADDSFPVTFMNGDELDTSCGCPVSFNPSTGTLKTHELIVDCICSQKGDTVGAFSNCQRFVSSDGYASVSTTTKSTGDPQTAITSMTCSGVSSVGCSVISLTTTQMGTSCLNLNSLYDPNSNINRNWLSIRVPGSWLCMGSFYHGTGTWCGTYLETNAVCVTSYSASSPLCIVVNNLPITNDTETNSYSLVGLSDIAGQLKRLSGLSYDPSTQTIVGMSSVILTDTLPDTSTNNTYIHEYCDIDYTTCVKHNKVYIGCNEGYLNTGRDYQFAGDDLDTAYKVCDCFNASYQLHSTGCLNITANGNITIGSCVYDPQLGDTSYYGINRTNGNWAYGWQSMSDGNCCRWGIFEDNHVIGCYCNLINRTGERVLNGIRVGNGVCVGSIRTFNDLNSNTWRPNGCDALAFTQYCTDSIAFFTSNCMWSSCPMTIHKIEGAYDCCDSRLKISTDNGSTWEPYALKCEAVVCDVAINSLDELKALPYNKDYDIYFTSQFNTDNGCPITQYSGARWYRSNRTNYLLVCAHNGAAMCMIKACNNGTFIFEQKFPYPGTLYGTASSTLVDICGTL